LRRTSPDRAEGRDRVRLWPLNPWACPFFKPMGNAPTDEDAAAGARTPLRDTCAERTPADAAIADVDIVIIILHLGVNLSNLCVVPWGSFPDPRVTEDRGKPQNHKKQGLENRNGRERKNPQENLKSGFRAGAALKP